MAETKQRNSDAWQKEIDQLRAKQATNLAHVEDLRDQKRDLALAANLGDADARKRLDKVNAELTAASFAADDLSVAIGQAEAEKASALAAEQRWIERLRMEDAARLVPEVLAAATEYSRGLDAAVIGARRVRQLIAEIGELVVDGNTKASLHRLLGGVSQNAFELTAVHSGLKEFVSLRGEPAWSDQNVRLEQNLELALQSLLEQAKLYSEMNPEDRKMKAELDAEFARQQRR